MPDQPDSNSSVHDILDLEQLILTCLCVSPNLRIRRDEILADLARHNWRAPEHRVVYEALRRMPGCNSSALRAELPSAATRMGFPDVDWNAYFAGAKNPEASEIGDLLRRLAAASGQTAGQP